MNERIEKLFSDAIELTIKDPRDLRGEDWDNECRKKFAELIVRECVNLCYDRAYRGTFGSFTDGAMLCANEIKEHFGVEL